MYLEGIKCSIGNMSYTSFYSLLASLPFLLLFILQHTNDGLVDHCELSLWIKRSRVVWPLISYRATFSLKFQHKRNYFEPLSTRTGLSSQSLTRYQNRYNFYFHLDKQWSNSVYYNHRNVTFFFVLFKRQLKARRGMARQHIQYVVLCLDLARV